MPDVCASDDECAPADLVCDPLPGICVECLFDADCGDARCVDRECVAISTCDNSLDCADAAGGAHVCDVATGECVACVTAEDCGSDEDCTDQQCVPYEACGNSLDCPSGLVCDSGAGRCVECTLDADCVDGQVCGLNRCREACESDRTCTPMGMLCDFTEGYCVDCLDDSLCPEEYYCLGGDCRLDVCVPGSTRCSGNSVLTCRARGDGYDAVACAENQTCVRQAGSSSCEDWVCTAGETECNLDNTAIITCSDDGLSVVDTAECDTDNEVCVDGECLELECVPSQAYCDGGTIRQCSDDGLSSTLVSTCSSNHVPTPKCTAAVCDGQCEAGWTDCNTDKLGDGCEVNTSTDVDHCGACGDPCSSNHLESQSCVDGECEGTCAATFDDCNDDMRTDGCETSLQTSPQHCGACNSPCDSDEVCVAGTCDVCNNAVLWLKDDITADSAAVEAALTSAGLVVTTINNGVVSYADDPPAADFGAILLSPGTTYASDMVSTGQAAIVAANDAGVGVVMTAWAGYHVTSFRWTTLSSLVLVPYSTGSSAGGTFTLTDTGHPIWDGLPTSFTTISVGIESGTVGNGGTAIATCDQCGGSGVSVRETAGRVVQIGHAGNYGGYAWYTDTNLLTMFSNAARWATGCF